MRIKVGSLPACAILLIAAASMGADAAYAQAQDSCLKAPNARAPVGSHWYFHTDPATQSKCWSLKPTGQAPNQAAQPVPGQTAQPAPVQARPAPAAPAAAVPAFAPPESSPWPQPGLQGIQQPDATTAAWPAPPPLPAANDTATPNSTLPVSPDQSAPRPGAAPAAETAQPNAPLTSTPANPAQEEPATQSASTPAAAVTPTKPLRNRVPLAAMLAGVFGLLAIGLLLRRLITMMLGRRRGIKITRQEPRLGDQEPRLGNAAKQIHPALLRHAPSLVPGQAETEHRISEVEDALRHLAQRLRHRRSAAPGNVPIVSRTGVRARS